MGKHDEHEVQATAAVPRTRPSPLLVDFPLRDDLAQHWHRGEVPVHRTFIEFGCPRRTLIRRRSLGSCTAPAATAPSISASLDLDAQEASTPGTPSTPPPRRREPSSGDKGVEAAPRTGSIPAVRYWFSPTSAKALGYKPAALPAVAPLPSKEAARPLRLESLILQEVQTPADLLKPAVGSEAPLGAADGEGTSSRSTDEGDSSDEEDEGLCPAYSANAELPSLGSAAHGDGTCKRCCFFPKGRCNNGFSCQFCHFAHEKRKPKNKKKLKKRSKKLSRLGDAAAFAMQMAHGAPHAFALGLCAVDMGEGMMQVGADYMGQSGDGHYYLAMMQQQMMPGTHPQHGMVVVEAPYCVY